MRGGFTGVDVFFVISGFLIGTLIIEDLGNGTFSLANFYARRVKRIFPALLLVLLASITFGWFVLFADEYQQLGRHVAAGAGFVANLVQWQEAGYFDNSASTKPLLHLWSLGAEEQFYIVWPVLMWMAWRLRLHLGWMIGAVVVASFALSLWVVRIDSVAAFYSPLTRIWEMLFGTFLAWRTLQGREPNVSPKPPGWVVSRIRADWLNADGRMCQFASATGLILLALGFWGVGENMRFPGGWAMVPVVGATLLIAAGPHAWVNRRLLSHPTAVWVGLISYPLYLWHWPLLSFARVLHGGKPTVGVRWGLLLTAVILAWGTFRLLERRVRFGRQGDSARVGILAGLMVAVAGIGLAANSADGFPQRAYHQRFASYKESIKAPVRADHCFELPFAYKKSDAWYCHLGPTGVHVKYFVFGDSHALSLLPALERMAQEMGVGIRFTGASGCPSLLGIQSLRGDAQVEKFNCRALNERVFEDVRSSGIPNVILANRWTYYTGSISRPQEVNFVARYSASAPDSRAASLETSRADTVWAIGQTVTRYASIGVRVIFVEDTPQQRFDPVDVLRKGRAQEDQYMAMSVARDEHVANQAAVNEALRSTGAMTVSFDDVLCGPLRCPLVSSGRFLYSDDDHLSVDGALKVYPHFVQQVGPK